MRANAANEFLIRVTVIRSHGIQTMFDIITIGSATRDVFLNMSAKWSHKDGTGQLAESLPLGAKIEVEKIFLTTGGGGTNSAVTFARQGLKTACIGVVGNDLNGQEILAELAKEGVSTEFFQKHSDDLTAYSTILVDPSGERTVLSYKGEGQHFEVVKIPMSELQAKWLYLNSLGGHYDLLEAIVRHAADNNMKIATNPGGKEIAHGLEKMKPILVHMDIYLTNKEEGEQLLGLSDKSSEEVATELKKYVKGIVSVSDGHNGVFVIDTEGNKYSAGVPDSPVVERTGAGDAFGSGFTAEYIRSENIEKSIQFGTANASSVVTQHGAKAGILKKGDWGQWPLVDVIEEQR